MISEINVSRFKDVADSIIKIDNDYIEKSLKLCLKKNPNIIGIMNIIRYLNNTDWKNFKFNQYSIKQNNNDYTVTFNYIVPKVNFSK